MEFDVRELEACDKPSVLELLATDHLRLEGILEEGTRYWGAFSDGRLIGVIGCEYENQCGLLRSALVHKQYRGKGIAEQLTRKLLHAADEMDLKAVYLFSTEAGKYWMRFGFEEVPVEEVTDRLPNAPQVGLFDKLGWLPTEIAYSIRTSGRYGGRGVEIV